MKPLAQRQLGTWNIVVYPRLRSFEWKRAVFQIVPTPRHYVGDSYRFGPLAFFKWKAER